MDSQVIAKFYHYAINSYVQQNHLFHLFIYVLDFHHNTSTHLHKFKRFFNEYIHKVTNFQQLFTYQDLEKLINKWNSVQNFYLPSSLSINNFQTFIEQNYQHIHKIFQAISIQNHENVFLIQKEIFHDFFQNIFTSYFIKNNYILCFSDQNLNINNFLDDCQFKQKLNRYLKSHYFNQNKFNISQSIDFLKQYINDNELKLIHKESEEIQQNPKQKIRNKNKSLIQKKVKDANKSFELMSNNSYDQDNINKKEKNMHNNYEQNINRNIDEQLYQIFSFYCNIYRLSEMEVSDQRNGEMSLEQFYVFCLHFNSLLQKLVSYERIIQEFYQVSHQSEYLTFSQFKQLVNNLAIIKQNVNFFNQAKDNKQILKETYEQLGLNFDEKFRANFQKISHTILNSIRNKIRHIKQQKFLSLDQKPKNISNQVNQKTNTQQKSYFNSTTNYQEDQNNQSYYTNKELQTQKEPKQKQQFKLKTILDENKKKSEEKQNYMNIENSKDVSDLKVLQNLEFEKVNDILKIRNHGMNLNANLQFNSSFNGNQSDNTRKKFVLMRKQIKDNLNIDINQYRKNQESLINNQQIRYSKIINDNSNKIN